MIDVFPSPRALAQYHRNGQWGTETIRDLISQQTSSRGHKVAVKDSNGGVLRYGELEDKALRLAGFMAARGVGRADVISMHLPNWYQTAIVVYAAYKLGAIVNPVLPNFGSRDLAYVLGKCASKVVVIAGQFRKIDYTEHLHRIAREDGVAPLALVIGEGSVNLGVSFDEALSSAPLARSAACESDDPAAILFTSGTESRPKGAVHTHNTILFGERAFAGWLGMAPSDVCFMATPLTHTTGFMHGLVLNLTTGATLTLLDLFSGDAAANIMRVDGATWTMGATVFLDDTMQAIETSGEPLPALRYFLCGGAPIPESAVRRAHSLGVRVLPVYGSTESPPHAAMSPDAPIEQAWCTDGRPLPGIETKIVDERGHALPPGVVGEEWSRGPNTFLGYLGEPELTQKALDQDSWLHSGDLAMSTADGSLKIVGRLKEMIIRGGQNISVREVEDLLAAHPSVREVAVVGTPHARLGESVTAVVVLKKGTALALHEVTDFLLARGVSKFKAPERLEIWDALPRTPSGKIQKYLIRQELNKAQA